MRDIILYYYDRKFIFYDIMNNDNTYIICDKDIQDINNVWVDYDSFNNDDNIKTLVNWIIRRKYDITCPIRDVKDIREDYNSVYKKHREEMEEWYILD